jgi:mRNA-degrading endonuclease RelE of RelBE toxin-antitoxin system
MSEYNAVYEQKFVNNVRRYAAMRKRIQQRCQRVLENPYHNTELLADASGGLDLRGCRSIRVDKNFRIIFIICEECRTIPVCAYCFCDGQFDSTVVFLTVGPHERAYEMK